MKRLARLLRALLLSILFTGIPGELNLTRSLAATETVGALATISLTSVPYGAEIYSDSLFVGKTPATLKLKPGRHSILLLMKDYKNWSREITVQSGSEAKLNASLEEQN